MQNIGVNIGVNICVNTYVNIFVNYFVSVDIYCIREECVRYEMGTHDAMEDVIMCEKSVNAVAVLAKNMDFGVAYSSGCGMGLGLVGRYWVDTLCVFCGIRG